MPTLEAPLAGEDATGDEVLEVADLVLDRVREEEAEALVLVEAVMVPEAVPEEAVPAGTVELPMG
jgi:hypothetical protein